MITSFDKACIWIIGASSGIGRHLAKELSRHGARLALSARREEALETLNRELGGQHLVVPFDVSNAEAVQAATKTVTELFPRLDSVLFFSATYTPGNLGDHDLPSSHQVFSVNVGGALNVIHTTLPVFHQQRFGQIVLYGSIAGYRGLPNGQPYSATKAAVINLAESLRCEQPNYIDVKVINSGFVRTPMTDKNKFKMPMLVEPEEAARIIAKGLRSKRFEIHFPKGFTCLAKLLRMLPYWLYFRVVRKIAP